MTTKQALDRIMQIVFHAAVNELDLPTREEINEIYDLAAAAYNGLLTSNANDMAKRIKALEAQRDELRDALKDARRVISTINASRHHKIVADGGPVFWQTEEWVTWALKEELPKIESAIAKAT